MFCQGIEPFESRKKGTEKKGPFVPRNFVLGHRVLEKSVPGHFAPSQDILYPKFCT